MSLIAWTFESRESFKVSGEDSCLCGIDVLVESQNVAIPDIDIIVICCQVVFVIGVTSLEVRDRVFEFLVRYLDVLNLFRVFNLNGADDFQIGRDCARGNFKFL